MIRVIIVEDDPMVAQLNAQYLASFPQLRVEAILTNGRDALSYLQSHETELAVVDMYMPMFNGLELLRSIHSLPPDQREVVYLRAFGGLSFREIGDVLGKTETWARVTFYRSKEKLRNGGASDEK